MKITQRLLQAAGLAAVLTLSACGSDDDTGPVVSTLPPPPVVVVPAEVPDSAGVSVGAFIAYLLSLSGNSESSEPAVIKDLFAVPVDETNEPQVLV